MNPSVAQIALTGRFEGCQLSAYRDVAGVPTIGFGHTASVRMGDVCTQAQADEWLEAELDDASAQVQALVSVPLTQGQLDALSDFVYNLGAGRLRDSTLLRLLNAGDYNAAAAQFQFWVMADGQPQPGLKVRRAANRAVFEGADPSCVATT